MPKKTKSTLRTKTTRVRTTTTAARATRKATSQRGDRSKRLLDLVMLLLRARAPVTFREIREQFDSYKTNNVEAGLRAFERDKADLLDLGVPIRYVTPDEDDSLEEGGYVVDLKKLRLPEVHLTTDEVSALVLAASVARAMPGGNYPKIVDLALKKLAFDMPEPPDTPMEFPPPASTPVLVHFPEQQKTSRAYSDNFARLETATRNRKRVAMTYQSASSGHAQSREVDPYGLVYREGAWLLVGYCHLRRDVRSFRVDRITALELAPRPKSADFDRPGDFDIRAYASRSPWTFMTGPAETIELEIRPEAADLANEDFGTEAEYDERPGGTEVVRFTCGNLDYAVSRILAAKGAVRVLAGDRLRRRLADELEAVRELYR